MIFESMGCGPMELLSRHLDAPPPRAFPSIAAQAAQADAEGDSGRSGQPRSLWRLQTASRASSPFGRVAYMTAWNISRKFANSLVINLSTI